MARKRQEESVASTAKQRRGAGKADTDESREAATDEASKATEETADGHARGSVRRARMVDDAIASFGEGLGDSDALGAEEAEGGGAAEEQDGDADKQDGDADTKGGLWSTERLKPVLEAVIFAAADPVPVRRMYQTISGATKAEVVAALAELASDCETRGVRLVEVAGGWQFRTAPEHHETIKKLFKERPYRLTRAGIETLAVVAYRQPVTRAEIEAIRGVDASGVLEGLVERRLARIAGRRDVPGRPLVYETTQEFLEVFGLKNLNALPTLAELGDEILTMADRSGIDQNDERDAPILPLEEGDSGDETQASGNDEAAHERTSGQRRRAAGADRLDAQEGSDQDESDEQSQAGEEDGAEGLEAGGQDDQAEPAGDADREDRPR